MLVKVRGCSSSKAGAREPRVPCFRSPLSETFVHGESLDNARPAEGEALANALLLPAAVGLRIEPSIKVDTEYPVFMRVLDPNPP